MTVESEGPKHWLDTLGDLAKGAANAALDAALYGDDNERRTETDQKTLQQPKPSAVQSLGAWISANTTAILLSLGIGAALLWFVKKR